VEVYRHAGFVTDRKNTANTAECFSKASVNGATVAQLHFLSACCISEELSNLTQSLTAQLSKQDASKLVLKVARATFYACAAYPSVLLSSEQRAYHAVHTIFVMGRQGALTDYYYYYYIHCAVSSMLCYLMLFQARQGNKPNHPKKPS
jgi:hypothetical protein